MWTGLTLSQPAPRRPASYGAASDLTITPSWPRASVSPRKAAAAGRVGGDRARDPQRLGDHGGHGGVALGPGLVEQVLAVQVEQVEQERGEGQGGGQPLHVQAAADPAGRDLERVGPPAGLEGDELAVEHGRPHRQRQGGRHHLGHPGGDVVQGPGEHGHLGPGPVHLDPGAVQLPLDGRLADLLHGRLDGRGRSRPASAGGGGRPPGGTGAARARPRPGRPRPPGRGPRAASAPGGPRPRRPRRPWRWPRPSPPPARPGAARPRAARSGTAARPRWPGRTARPPAAAARPGTRARPGGRSARRRRRPRPRSGRGRPPGRARPAAPPSRPRSGAGAARRRGTPPPGGPPPAPGAAGRPPAAPPWPGGRSWRRRRRTSRRPRRAARGHCPPEGRSSRFRG